MSWTGRGSFVSIVAAVSCAVAALPAAAQDAAEFYKGRTVDLIISTEAGVGFDTGARLVARHITRHIPGNPSIVPRNMPGAGHVRAANFLYNQAAKDGSVIGSFVPAFVTASLVDRTDAIQFVAAKFSWLGSTSWSNSTIFVSSRTGVKTVEDAKTREVLMGGTGAGSLSTLYPVIMNNLVGTRFKLIGGYKGTADVNLALERGEVDGRAGNNFNSLKIENGAALREGRITVLVQIGLERDPEFKHVPLMIDLAPSDEARQILTLFSADVAIGRPLLAPPGIPADRLAVLRKALDATVRDAEYLKEAKDAGLDTAPISGDRVQKIVEDLAATPAEVLARAKAVSVAK